MIIISSRLLVNRLTGLDSSVGPPKIRRVQDRSSEERLRAESGGLMNEVKASAVYATEMENTEDLPVLADDSGGDGTCVAIRHRSVTR